MFSRELLELTPNQREVLACLRTAGAPLGAYAVLARVRDAGIIYPSTVYRALNELVRLGLAHRIESLGLFVACTGAPCGHSSGFLICSGCQKVVEVPLRSDQRDLLGSFPQEEIEVERLVALEFVGRCRACRAALAEPERARKGSPPHGYRREPGAAERSDHGQTPRKRSRRPAGTAAGLDRWRRLVTL
jgi:Fur family zinc uptake transcriptional regulator